MTYKNRLRQMLLQKDYIVGSGILTRETVIVEMLGAICDFIWIDWEHSWLDRGNIMDSIIACRAAGTASLVRVPWNDPVLAKPILDMGPDGIIFPQIHNAAEAKEAIAACTYPPEGVRGWGPLRASEYGAIPPGQYAGESNDRIFKILQVENTECIESLDEILEVDGVDCVCVGPMDLSASLGKLGGTRDAEVIAVFDRIGEIAARHRVPLMVSCNFDPIEIKEWKDRGVRIFEIASEMAFLRKAALSEISETKRICGIE